MLKLKLFGEFSLSTDRHILSEENCHSPRILRALLYLLAKSGSRVSLKDFAHFLREGKSYSAPASYSVGSDSLVKTTLFRIRSLLAPLAEDEPALRLLCADGGLFFDPDLVIHSDVHRFDEVYTELCARPEGFSKDSLYGERTLFLCRTLADLYKGDYLPLLAKEGKCLAESRRYRAAYAEIMEKYFALLLDTGEYSELIEKTSASSAIDPYFESAHYYKLSAYLALGEADVAKTLYKSVEKLFLDSFGINPSARLRRLKNDFTPAAETASELLTALFSLAEEPLTPEGFAAILSYAKNKDKRPFTFALITLSALDKCEGVATLLKNTCGCYLRKTPLQFSVFFPCEEEKSALLQKALLTLDGAAAYEETHF